MTTSTDLSNFRSIIEDHLASDEPIEIDSTLQKILYMLDDLQHIHELLDKCDVPRDLDNVELDIYHRLVWLIGTTEKRSNILEDLFDHMNKRVEYIADSSAGIGRSENNSDSMQLSLCERKRTYSAIAYEIEIRLRVKGDLREWKDIPAIRNKAKDANQANERAMVEAFSNRACLQVRWNWTGSHQGHYLVARLPESED
jgi:hypothetical protein